MIVPSYADFNSRSPCGERPSPSPRTPRQPHFNSRSPCGERPRRTTIGATHSNFNSRSPCGERLVLTSCLGTCWDFNSRSPCEERPAANPEHVEGELFQLTLPVWGATHQLIASHRKQIISTHAPRVGSDPA